MDALTLGRKAAFAALVEIGCTEESANRMLGTARMCSGFGPVNFPHGGQLYGLKYEAGYFTLGDADFSVVMR